MGTTDNYPNIRSLQSTFPNLINLHINPTNCVDYRNRVKVEQRDSAHAIQNTQ